MNVSTNKEINYLVFIFVFYSIIFRKFLENYMPFLGVADEAFAALAIPIFFLKLIKNKWKIKKHKKLIPIFLSSFVIVSFLGNLMYGYQPYLTVVFPDMFLNLKFWLSIYVASNIFKDLNLERYGKKIGYHIKAVTIMFVSLILVDWILNLFPGDIRYGVKSTQLFYGVHTVFAAICAFLIALIILIKAYIKYYPFYTGVLLVLMASTMRSKAFGAVLLFLLLYYIVYYLKKKIRVWHIIFMGVTGILIGWTQIQYYFFSSMRDGSARNLLLRKCFVIAADHFPFGAGFGTFASYFSSVVYSPIYAKYGLSSIYGLTQNNPAYISDSFWPMIIGQSGYIGLILYFLLLITLFTKIQNLSKINKEYYLASLFALTYLCISSMAEAAFVSPISIPLAIVIGISIAKGEQLQNRGNISKFKSCYKKA